MKENLDSTNQDLELPTSDSQLPTPDSQNPPIMSSWKNLYLLVLGNLAFMIILLYIFSNSFK